MECEHPPPPPPQPTTGSLHEVNGWVPARKTPKRAGVERAGARAHTRAVGRVRVRARERTCGRSDRHAKNLRLSERIKHPKCFSADNMSIQHFYFNPMKILWVDIYFGDWLVEKVLVLRPKILRQ